MLQVDPTANAGYLIAAYLATAAILCGYALILYRRANRR